LALSRFVQVRPEQSGASEIGPSKIAPSEVGPAQVASWEIGFSKIGPAEIYRESFILYPPEVPDIHATQEDTDDVRLAIAILIRLELYRHSRFL
jgi:hypothetical protein